MTVSVLRPLPEVPPVPAAAPVAGGKPDLRWIPLEALMVDQAYQRGVAERDPSKGRVDG